MERDNASDCAKDAEDEDEDDTASGEEEDNSDGEETQIAKTSRYIMNGIKAWD